MIEASKRPGHISWKQRRGIDGIMLNLGGVWKTEELLKYFCHCVCIHSLNYLLFNYNLLASRFFLFLLLHAEI
jgi:hypothetical protein